MKKLQFQGLLNCGCIGNIIFKFKLLILARIWMRWFKTQNMELGLLQFFSFPPFWTQPWEQNINLRAWESISTETYNESNWFPASNNISFPAHQSYSIRRKHYALVAGEQLSVPDSNLLVPKANMSALISSDDVKQLQDEVLTCKMQTYEANCFPDRCEMGNIKLRHFWPSCLIEISSR